VAEKLNRIYRRFTPDLPPMQLRKIAFKVKNSPTITAPAWKKACKESKLSYASIPRDQPTRWNSTYQLLSFAIKYKAAFTVLLDRASLKLPSIAEDEWEGAEQLCSLLEVFSFLLRIFSLRLIIST
jgi:hypothetical protein